MALRVTDVSAGDLIERIQGLVEKRVIVYSRMEGAS
jgi:hypothetical protein